jgi:hypothetical protein
MLHVALIFISFIWTVIWIAISSLLGKFWPMFIAAPGILYLVGISLYMIAHVWIINPIKELKKKKEKIVNNKNK